jgi:hypothetical protein
MRCLLPAVSACLVLSSFAASFAMALALPIGGTAPANPAAAPPAVPAAANSDDAAKHAKRTNCLKEAKVKKLIGAQKTAFIKDCVSAP